MSFLIPSYLTVTLCSHLLHSIHFIYSNISTFMSTFLIKNFVYTHSVYTAIQYSIYEKEEKKGDRNFTYFLLLLPHDYSATTMSANKNNKSKRNLGELASELGSAWDPPASSRRRPCKQAKATSSGARSDSQEGHENTARMSSRGNQRRGPNRNSEIGEHGEELAMWKDVKDKIPLAAEAFNESSANILQIRDQDKRMAEKKDKNGNLNLPLYLFLLRNFSNHVW